MKKFKFLLIVILGIAVFFAVSMYITSEKEKKVLFYSIKQLEQQISGLEKEKQVLCGTIEKTKEAAEQLNAKNKELAENLKTAEDKLAKSVGELSQARSAIEEVNSELAILKDERDRLMIQFAEAAQEKDMLKARISSVFELKKAMKELKTQMRDVTHEIKRRVKAYTNYKGNRGFLIKNGTPTRASKVRIKVEPALKEK